jgi:hypothetical protein
VAEGWLIVWVLAVIFFATPIRSAFGFGEALIAVPLPVPRGGRPLHDLRGTAPGVPGVPAHGQRGLHLADIRPRGEHGVMPGRLLHRQAAAAAIAALNGIESRHLPCSEIEMSRLYNYVGPSAIKACISGRPAGMRIASASDLLAWARRADRGRGLVAATFIIDASGHLLLADRRSEHVACAGGGPVLSAGEMFFVIDGGRVEVVEVSNQSTGYCPEPESWPAVAAALDRIGVPHPDGFTLEIVFRRCPKCGERNVVKDGWFACGACGTELAREWNFG